MRLFHPVTAHDYNFHVYIASSTVLFSVQPHQLFAYFLYPITLHFRKKSTINPATMPKWKAPLFSHSPVFPLFLS